jgi:hypothetical protein
MRWTTAKAPHPAQDPQVLLYLVPCALRIAGGDQCQQPAVRVLDHAARDRPDADQQVMERSGNVPDQER